MADETNFRRRDEVFWSNLVKNSSSEEEDAYIPGLSAPGNKRPSRVKGRKTKEVKAKVPVRQPVIENSKPSLTEAEVLPKEKPRNPTLRKPRDSAVTFQCSDSVGRDDSGMSTTFESFAERSIRRLQQASLKDLRPEDKQRVANLIKELARVGEEKEQVVKELQGEREQYERQLMTLVGQQEKILQEREDIQEKLFQCQKLLTEYQAQLLDKQERLNTSIHVTKEAMANSSQALKLPRCVPSTESIRPTNPGGMIEICPPVYDLSEMDERSLTPVQINRVPSPIIQQDPRYRERQSRSREVKSAREPGLTNQNRLDDYLANQEQDNESVSDLLLNQEERIKRPYSSMIDKEIARERSLSRGSRDSRSDYSRSRSNSGSHSEGRPRFAYPQKISGIGPLQEPLAHSTQKSLEIRAHYDNESLASKSTVKGHDSKVKGQQNGRIYQEMRDQSPANSENMKSKVAFNDKDEYDENAEMHSPNMKPATELFSDPDYATYYKKLSPGGRKRELLKQRQALLDEQERLRKILERQERQLQNRKYEYDKRKELQEQRMQFYKENGKFPALKLDFDAGSEKGSGLSEEERFEERRGERNDGSQVEMYSPRQVEIGDEVQVRSRVSLGTSPIATPPRGNRVSMATSPIHSQGSREVDDTCIPQLVDAATSISYRTPLKDSGNQQGNLPLGCNRQRMKELHLPSPRSEGPPSVRTPGEKTLGVVELVNSMEEEETSSLYRNRLRDNIENRPSRQNTKRNQSSPYQQYTSPAQLRTSARSKLLSDQEESMEEIQILEDIFFL